MHRQHLTDDKKCNGLEASHREQSQEVAPALEAMVRCVPKAVPVGVYAFGDPSGKVLPPSEGDGGQAASLCVI